MTTHADKTDRPTHDEPPPQAPDEQTERQEAPVAHPGPAPVLSDEVNAEIDAAMADLDATQDEHQRPRQAIRGPRVIEAGR
jgi:hypothetical protein